MSMPSLSEEEQLYRASNRRIADNFFADKSKPLEKIGQDLITCRSNERCQQPKYCLRCGVLSSRAFWAKHNKALADIRYYKAFWITGSFNHVNPMVKLLKDAINQLKTSLRSLVRTTFGDNRHEKSPYLGHIYTIHVTSLEKKINRPKSMTIKTFRPHIHMMLFTDSVYYLNYGSIRQKWYDLNGSKYDTSSNKNGDPLDIEVVGGSTDDTGKVLNYMKHEQNILDCPDLGPKYAKSILGMRLQETCGYLQGIVQRNQATFKDSAFQDKYPNLCNPNLKRQGFIITK